MTKRRNFSDKFKATVALESLRRDKTIQEIAAKRQLHPTQVTAWKRQAQEGLAGVFSDKAKKSENKESEIKDLHAKIGQLTVENDASQRFRGPTGATVAATMFTRAEAMNPSAARQGIAQQCPERANAAK